ncbi:MAG: GAF domain-containing protein [Gammaproteobacteria bacterium]|nr:GAF domain-containing protein [Gammaproteobacteria bacterium]
MSDIVPLFAHAGLDTCDREPIHIPGSIQPHGVLLVVERDDFTIREYAGDIRFVLGIDPGRLRQMSLASLFDQAVVLQTARHVRDSTKVVMPSIILNVGCTTGSLPLDLTIHARDRRVVVEIEPARRSLSIQGDPLARVTNMISELAEAVDVESSCAIAARTARALFGFDRASVYQFQSDQSGRVIAEDAAEGVEGFLDLHFPASDIPAQAREMYRRTWLRVIPDIDYTPAPLIACPGVTVDEPLDMTCCSLRSVSPIHLEYLRNMGVTASASLSIVIRGQLWGLIACHNYSPRYVATDLRAAGELYAQIFSLHLAATLETDTARRRIAPRAAQVALANSVPLASDIASALVEGEVTVRDLISAGGVAVLQDKRVLTLGETPPAHFILALSDWLDGSGSTVFSSNRLPADFPPAAEFSAIASGLLAVAVSREPSNYVMWFRPELARTVKWAGNPHKLVDIGVHGIRLTPRKSFEAWQEEVRGFSSPWDEVDVASATAFRLWLLETVMKQMEEARREREAQYSRQNVLMAELDHRVKNSLMTIQTLARHGESNARSLSEYVDDLERRIIAMGRAHAVLAEDKWDGASLHSLFSTALRGHVEAGSPQIELSGPDCRLSVAATMTLAMVIHELMTNAERYGALSLPGGRVGLKWSASKEDHSLVIRWKERDGPPVAEPIRRGFGAMIIERSLAYELQGSSELMFERDGVACTMVIPNRHLTSISME